MADLDRKRMNVQLLLDAGYSAEDATLVVDISDHASLAAAETLATLSRNVPRHLQNVTRSMALAGLVVNASEALLLLLASGASGVPHEIAKQLFLYAKDNVKRDRQ